MTPTRLDHYFHHIYLSNKLRTHIARLKLDIAFYNYGLDATRRLVPTTRTRRDEREYIIRIRRVAKQIRRLQTDLHHYDEELRTR